MNRPPPGRGTWTEAVITLAAVALFLAFAFTIDPLRNAMLDALNGDTEAVREDLRGLGAGGVALVAGLAMAHTIVWYPAEILDAAVGFVYGFWVALPMIMVFWLGNALAAYAIGAKAGRPVIWKLAGQQRFERVERAVEEGGATLLLAMRLIPIVPFSFFSIAAGAARVPLGRFCWTTMVGYLPITAIFVYLGTQLEELSPTDPILWISAAALVAMLLLARWLKPRIEGPADPAPKGDET